VHPELPGKFEWKLKLALDFHYRYFKRTNYAEDRALYEEARQAAQEIKDHKREVENQLYQARQNQGQKLDQIDLYV
jgi:hypothetical protein